MTARTQRWFLICGGGCHDCLSGVRAAAQRTANRCRVDQVIHHHRAGERCGRFVHETVRPQ